MKCPYRMLVLQQTQATMGYDDNANNTSQGTWLQESAEFADCYKDECTMWQDGKCVRVKK